jgi:Na+/H+ antiporter NhaD/arsenite permease-like protein
MEISVPMSHTHGTGARLSRFDWAAIALAAAALAFLIVDSLRQQAGEGGDHGHEIHTPSIWSVIPFVGVLLSIAILPLVPATSHWWESNRNRLAVALCFAAITLVYYLLTQGAGKVVSVLQHAVLAEYIPFIMLLFALYVISGGISLQGDLPAHPATNTAFLAAGALMASFIGTTGASMLLIRPLLQTNAERHHVRHTVIFFIFLVSNIGGCLLPIGDPPLFLGYLKGVPFLWTFGLWKEWAFMVVLLLIVYYIWDVRMYRHETKRDISIDETQRTRLQLRGSVNFLFLAGVVLCVAVVDPTKEIPGLGFKPFPFLRELLMVGLVALSLWTTRAEVRRANHFNYHAILEVAALFIGIFICMQAPIEILKTSGAALSGFLKSPAHFFWSTGVLSSFLDNAPTYVVFFETASSMTPDTAAGALHLPGKVTILEPMLIAVSLGSVFMGAMTYIGNGPNFMVKSIAEQAGVRMPSFFGYMVYSTALLIPPLILVTLLFL